MSTSMGTVAGDEGARGVPQPTHIDVHIHQEPALNLSCLLRPSALHAPPQTAGSRRLLVASAVLQIVLGLLSGALGGLGCLSLYQPWPFLVISQAGIWAGAVAMLAGVSVFIYEKRGGILWALLKTLLALAAFGTAIGATYTGAYYFVDGRYLFFNLCRPRNTWLPTAAPTTPESDHRWRLCQSYMGMFQALITGLQTILLSIWVLLILTSLVPPMLFCWRKCRPKAEKDQKALLGTSEM
ncbi:transmembrane protein 176A [Pteronotus mesoamericanus]|uniref:transmembrane protein 176A n=1 Tax=Pteronotus mesoamericanus TaxID=1884717 RepID=UPI0023EBCAFF|nr:transmembrane protein 176A [Pteronotus parnellii mesoamericanus]XP_054449454.1 transmembrane protein 176A [Pteronotus parnellii mesoamericanus]